MRKLLPIVVRVAQESHAARPWIPLVTIRFAYDSPQALPVREGAVMPEAAERGQVAAARPAS
jgi:hypothetical protein